MVATNQIKNFENQTYSWVTNRSPCPYSHGLDDQASLAKVPGTGFRASLSLFR
jgi:hypothetical protein